MVSSLQDGIPIHVDSDALVINTSSHHQASYRCMVQLDREVAASPSLQLDIRQGMLLFDVHTEVGNTKETQRK